MPWADSLKAASEPEYIEKATRGPVALITVDSSGPPAIAGKLVQWFVFCLVVSVFVAYLTGRVMGPGAEYMAVFRISGTVAFGAYALALIEDSIWYRRQWSTTLKNVFDGFLFALVTAGMFGWLWPGAA